MLFTYAVLDHVMQIIVKWFETYAGFLLQRADRDWPEDLVLMRTLRDFNLPKIVTDDRTVFMGLLGDLFPGLNPPRKRELEFEAHVKQAALDMGLQPEDGFILKVRV